MRRYDASYCRFFSTGDPEWARFFVSTPLERDLMPRRHPLRGEREARLAQLERVDQDASDLPIEPVGPAALRLRADPRRRRRGRIARVGDRRAVEVVPAHPPPGRALSPDVH